MNSVLVSVVVIGRNEGPRLRGCLASVAAMLRNGWEAEVIYVDSGSADGSPELAQAMGAQVIGLRPELPTAALGRNAGWRAARGEFILFLDGDTVLAPEFAARALPAFVDDQVAVVWGHRRELFPERSVYNRVLDLDWIYAPGLAAFCGGDALFRRKVLEMTAGFDETLIAGEEPELCRRILALGGVILHVDLPMTGHDLAITGFGQYWRRATRAGHAYAEVSERFRGSGAAFWEEEVRRNQVRAGMLCGGSVVILTAAAVLQSWWPVTAGVGLAAAVVARTAWKARWKSRDWGTLLLYGVHSQFQQVPIWWGQERFRRRRRAGERVALVEYKG